MLWFRLFNICLLVGLSELQVAGPVHPVLVQLLDILSQEVCQQFDTGVVLVARFSNTSCV